MARAESLNGVVAEARREIARGQASLISLREKLRNGAVPSGERAVIGELGTSMLITAQRLVDLVTDIGALLEDDLARATKEVGDALEARDLIRASRGVTAASNRVSSLGGRFTAEGRADLESVRELADQLSALDRALDGRAS